MSSQRQPKILGQSTFICSKRVPGFTLQYQREEKLSGRLVSQLLNLPKMGRFYSGDIEGKFWFAVQDSVDAQHFGGTMDYLDEEGEVWEDGDEGQPVEVAFNFGPNDHDSIQKGLKRCEAYLGEFGPKIDEFFSNHETYTTEMLGKFLEVGEPQALDFLMVYARRELGRKIWECVQEKGECNFTGEL